MTTTSKKAAGRKVRLNSHEINVVSVIAQKRDLPHSYLLKFARESDISPQAYLVVRSLLQDSVSGLAETKAAQKKVAVKKLGAKKQAAKKKRLPRKSSTTEAANDFSRWAATLK